MPKRPTKKQALELAIEAIDFRLDNLTTASLSINCVLCEVYQKQGCKGCPADDAEYNCESYVRELSQIRSKLVYQKHWFKLKLQELGGS